MARELIHGSLATLVLGYFFLYPLFIMEPADFILLDLEEGLAFSIFIILPLGMVFLVGILLFFVARLSPLCFGLGGF